MNLVYKNVASNVKLLILTLKIAVEDTQKYSELNHAFYLRTLLDFLVRHNPKKFSLLLNTSQFSADVLANFEKRTSSCLTHYNFIRCIFTLHDLKCLDENLDELYEAVYSLENTDEDHSYLYELVFSRCDKDQLKKLLWYIFERSNLKEASQLERFLIVLSIFLAKLNRDDYDTIGDVNLMDVNVGMDLSESREEDLSQNWIEFFVDMFLVKNVPHLEPRIRALSVKSIGNNFSGRTIFLHFLLSL